MRKAPFFNLVETFRQKAQERPDHIAIVYENTRLTYGEVDRLSDNLAAYIETQIPAGSVVGIMLGRNENMMVAPLGALKAGCAYLPLDPSYPPERLEFLNNLWSYYWLLFRSILFLWFGSNNRLRL